MTLNESQFDKTLRRAGLRLATEDEMREEAMASLPARALVAMDLALTRGAVAHFQIGLFFHSVSIRSGDISYKNKLLCEIDLVVAGWNRPAIADAHGTIAWLEIRR